MMSLIPSTKPIGGSTARDGSCRVVPSCGGRAIIQQATLVSHSSLPPHRWCQRGRRRHHTIQASPKCSRRGAATTGRRRMRQQGQKRPSGSPTRTHFEEERNLSRRFSDVAPASVGARVRTVEWSLLSRTCQTPSESRTIQASLGHSRQEAGQPAGNALPGTLSARRYLQKGPEQITATLKGAQQ